MKKINNFLFLGILSLTILFIISFLFYPFFRAISKPHPDFIFSGSLSYFDPWDINLYISAIHSGQQGNILYANLYTTALNSPILIFTLYTIIGFLFQNISPFILYDFASLLFSLILIIVIYFCLKLFVKPRIERLVSLITICLGGGLGFLFTSSSSPDIKTTQFTFYSAFFRPHEALVLTSLISSVCLFYYFLDTNKKLQMSHIFYITTLFFLTVFVHPYMFVIGFLLMLVVTLLNSKRININITIFLALKLFIGVFTAGLYYWQFRFNPTFHNLLAHDYMKISPASLLIGYGILTFLFLYQFFFIKKDKKTIFLNAWFSLGLILSFLPFGFSRLFLDNLFFPLIILSLISINHINKTFNINRVLLFGLFIFLMIQSDIYITKRVLILVNQRYPFYYLSKQEYKAVEYLAETPDKYSGVLSLYRFGNLIPAFTSHSAYLGHLIETPNFENSFNKAVQFYANQLDNDQAENFLRTNRIKYIVYGNEEKIYINLTFHFNNQGGLKYDFVKPVFKNEWVELYNVNLPN